MNVLMIAVLLATIGGVDEPRPTPMIVAHRGASHDAPENTLAAFALAWSRGADACEGDFRLTRDGRIVAFHDRDLKRLCKRDGRIEAMAFDDVRRLDVGSWKGARWRDERPPTLAEVLATVPPKKRFLIELKAGPEIVPALVRDVRASKLAPDQTIVIAFDRAAAQEAKRKLPDRKVYWLSGFKRDDAGRTTPTVESLVRDAKAAGVDGLDVDARGPIDAAFVKHVRDAGLELHVWTVNDVALAERMRRLGVDSITTDRPGWLRKRLAVR